MKSLLPLGGLAGSENALAWVDRDGFVHKYSAEENPLYPDLIPSVLLLADGSHTMSSDYSPSLDTDIATKGYVDANAGGSQTPLLSDIDCANFMLNDLGSISMHDGSTFNGNTWFSSSTSSYMSVIPDATFGINNGEAAGVGSDINLVSQNGDIILGGTSITGVSGTLPFSDGSGVGVDLISSISHARIWGGYVSGPRGTVDFVPEFDSNPDVGLRVAIYDGLFEGGTDVGTCFMQCSPAAGGYGVLESPAGLGMILSTGNGTTPVILAVNRVEGARLYHNGTTRVFLVGATSDDGSGALIQSAGDVSAAGSYWSAGSQGMTQTVPYTDDTGSPGNLVFVGGVFIGTA